MEINLYKILNIFTRMYILFNFATSYMKKSDNFHVFDILGMFLAKLFELFGNP